MQKMSWKLISGLGKAQLSLWERPCSARDVLALHGHPCSTRSVVVSQGSDPSRAVAPGSRWQYLAQTLVLTV